MKTIYSILFITSLFLLIACGGNETSSNAENQTTEQATPEKVIKTTKQFVTNEDGSVSENSIAAEIQFFADKIAFVFASDAAKNFEIPVTGKTDSPEGTKYTVKDKKYTEVFVAAGAEPQVNLNAAYGSTTFM